MKKLIVYLCSIVLVCSCLFGCAPLLPSDRLKESTDPVNVKLDKNTTADIEIGVSLTQADSIGKIITAFNKIYPNITVTPRIQPDNGQTILTWNQAEIKKPGTTPDILYFNSSEFIAFASGDALKDVTQYLKASCDEGNLNKDDLKQEFLNLGKLGYKADGKQYLMPTHYDQVVALINKEQFGAAGITINKPGTEEMSFTYTVEGQSSKTVKAMEWTWAEFEEVLSKLKTYYDRAGFTAQSRVPATLSLAWDAMLFPIIESYGGNIFDENNNVIIESQEVKDALNFIRGLIYDKKYSKYNSELPLSTGQVAVQFQSRPATLGLESTAIKGKWDVAAMPSIDIKGNPKVGGGSHGYAMYKYTNNPNEAWAFIEFMFTQQGQDIFGETGAHVPLLKSMDKDTAENKWNWRKQPSGVNHDAFLCYPERLAPVDFMSGLPFGSQADIYAETLTGLKSALESLKTPDMNAILANTKTRIEFEMKN